LSLYPVVLPSLTASFTCPVARTFSSAFFPDSSPHALLLAADGDDELAALGLGGFLARLFAAAGGRALESDAGGDVCPDLRELGLLFGSEAGGTAIVPPGGAGAAMGIALLSDDGKTLTFPNTITQFTIQYIPRAENIGNEFAPKT
jgi:hypothetical protein